MTKPESPNKTRMTAPATGTKMVKVQAVRAFKYKDSEGKKKIAQPGDQVEVSAEQAEELTKKRSGNYSFGGERFEADGNVDRHNIARAKTIA